MRRTLQVAVALIAIVSSVAAALWYWIMIQPLRGGRKNRSGDEDLSTLLGTVYRDGRGEKSSD